MENEFAVQKAVLINNDNVAVRPMKKKIQMFLFLFRIFINTTAEMMLIIFADKINEKTTSTSSAVKKK